LIYVDRREAATLGRGNLSELKEYEIKELAYGDFAIVVGDKAAIFERKRTTEFPAMLTSQRVFEQLQGLKTFDGEQYLIVEGSLAYPDYIKKSYVRSPQVVGFLVAVQRSFDIEIIPSANPHQTCIWLNTLHERMTKEAKGTVKKKVFATFKRLGKTPKDIALSMLACAVGPAFADKLLKHFGTFYNVISVAATTANNLTVVEGVGKKTAEKLVDVVNAKYDRPK